MSCTNRQSLFAAFVAGTLAGLAALIASVAIGVFLQALGFAQSKAVAHLSWHAANFGLVPFSFGFPLAISMWWVWREDSGAARWRKPVLMSVAGGLLFAIVGFGTARLLATAIARAAAEESYLPTWTYRARDFLPFAAGALGVFVGCGLWLGGGHGRREWRHAALGVVCGLLWGLPRIILYLPHPCFEPSVPGALFLVALFLGYHLGTLVLRLRQVPKFSLRSLSLFTLLAGGAVGLAGGWGPASRTLTDPLLWLVPLFSLALAWSLYRDREHFKSLAAKQVVEGT